MAHQDQSTNKLRVRRRVQQEDEHSRRGSTADNGMFYLEDLWYDQFICTLCSVLLLTSD